jgi:cytochrome c
MHKAALAATTIVVFSLTGCGQSDAETESASAPPDAEAPYATPPAPPAHVVSSATPVADADKDSDLKSPDEGERMEFAASSSEHSKVTNVTTAANDAKAAVSPVAAAGDDALKSTGGDSDAFLALQGDADRGRRLYGQCQGCHAVKEGQNRAGPSLYGIVGRQVGAVESFRFYSDATKEADFVWTEDALFAYLENPREYLPGTTMIYGGLPREQDRADVVAYLKTISE